MTLPIIRPRRPLKQWNLCLQNGVVTIGFLGGSITDARPRHNWPEYVREWLMSTYSIVRFRIENAAIGATGSDLAALRVKRDIIERKCDVVFIEYAVNDKDVSSERRRRTQEGVIRQLYKAGITELVFVYTFSGDMKEEMEHGRYPVSIAELEELASHYHIPSIWVGKYGLEQVAEGKLSMGQWLPDGLHPQEQGSRIYADCVISYLRSELHKPIVVEESNTMKKYDAEAVEWARSLQEQGPEAVNRANKKHESEAMQCKQPEQLPSEHSAEVWRLKQAEGSLQHRLLQSDLPTLPKALDPHCWEYVADVPMSDIRTEGQWVEQRWHDYEMDRYNARDIAAGR